MQSDPVLSALITRNIGEYEQTRQYLDEVLYDELLGAFEEVFKSALEGTGLFVGTDASEADFWFRRDGWANNGETDDWGRFYFYLSHQDDGEDDESWLSHFTGTAPSGAGAAIYFEQDCVAHRGKWNAFISDQTPEVKAILDAGFSLERPSYLCLPFSFDQEELAVAFGDEAPADAMHPLRAVIGKIVESLPMFDELIAKAEMQVPMRQG